AIAQMLKQGTWYCPTLSVYYTDWAPADTPAGQRDRKRAAVHGPSFQKALKAGIKIVFGDRKSTRLNSSLVSISYAVFCLKKKHPAAGPGPLDHAHPRHGVMALCACGVDCDRGRSAARRSYLHRFALQPLR